MRTAIKSGKFPPFGGLHPTVQFLYFTAVILYSMFLMHPVFLAVSLTCGFACSVRFNAGKALRFSLHFLLPLIFFTTLINPLLNHEGNTAVLYINNSAITAESILYGAAAGGMFASVLLWFSCSNAVMTSDRITYLFGRRFPFLSLVFIMVLRFVPHFKTQAKVIADAQKGIGRGVDSGSLLTRAKNGMKILSILTTWALENGIITADSMRARGFGLPNRSQYSLFKYNLKDKLLLLILLVLIAIVMVGLSIGTGIVRFFPTVSAAPVTTASLPYFVAYFLLCSFPLWFNALSEVQYHVNI